MRTHSECTIRLRRRRSPCSHLTSEMYEIYGGSLKNECVLSNFENKTTTQSALICQKKDNIEQHVDIKRIPSKLKQSKCETHLFKCKLVEITTEFTFTDTSLNILLLHATHLHAFPLHTSGFRIFLYNSHESARAHFESDTSAVNSRALHNTRALCVAPWQCDIAMHARADQITK